VPHLNELDEEFSEKGLSVIGVTSEPSGPTEKWIAKKKAAYAYGYDKGGKLKRALGVGGIPAAFLVDPSGTIVWQGHPSNLSSNLIKEHIKGAISKPLYMWSGKAGKIKKNFLKGDFAKAFDEARKLAKNDPFGEEAAELLQGILTSRVAGLQAALEVGDILAASDGAKVLLKGLNGLPEADTLKAMLKVISKDKEMKATMKLQKRLAKVMEEDLRRRKECDERVVALERLLKGHQGTYFASQVEAAIEATRVARTKMEY